MDPWIPCNEVDHGVDNLHALAVIWVSVEGIKVREAIQSSVLSGVVRMVRHQRGRDSAGIGACKLPTSKSHADARPLCFNPGMLPMESISREAVSL